MGKKTKKFPKNKINQRGDRNRRPSKEEETYVDKQDGKEEKYKFRNHPSDFIPDEPIRKQVGSFSFNGTIGIPLNIDQVVNGTSKRTSVNMPSVMGIDLYSSIGAIEGVDSPDGINVSGQKYYNILSSMNAKTTQYQPEDISLVEILIASFMEQVANAIRLYGVVFNFNPRNREVPDNLVKSMGVVPDSLSDDGDVSGFRMRLNRILTKANQIKFIKDLAIFKRSWELASRIFIDETSSMGQYYVFRPAGYWLLTETASTSRAEWVRRETLITAQELLDDIELMLNKLLTSSIFNYIYTDMLNYADKKGAELVTFAYVPELVQVFGVYDPGILNQIHNMTWGGANLDGYHLVDLVDENRLVSSNPCVNTNRGLLLTCNGDQILDHLYTDQPTYDDNVDAVAFKTTFFNVIDGLAAGTYTAQGIYLPDHPVLNVKIFKGSDVINMPSNYFNVNTPIGTTPMASIAPFKVSPIFWIVDFTEQSKVAPVSSFNFYTEMEADQIRNMFEYFYLGLYNIDVKDVKPFQ